jgi:hypothetical protein
MLVVLKQMARSPSFILVGCVVSAGLILIEFGPIVSHRPSPGAAPEIPKLADPLLSPAPRRPETASSAGDAASLLRGVRLTGVVIGPDLRIAIFALTGANSRVLSEGKTLEGWRLDSISPQGVVLNGPAGNIVLEPQPDANLVRSPPPAAVQSGQPGPAMADVPGQPIAVTPIAVGNVSAVPPVQTQGYPSYFPEYYSGNDPYSEWGWGWDNPWVWGWPVGVSVGSGGCWNCGFRGVSFRPGFRRLGFGHPAFIHSGFGGLGFSHASFGAGFRGGGRR